MRVISLVSLGAAGVVATSPVSKVVKLLEDMQKELETEAEKDANTQTKMDCWCKKTKADAEGSIEESNTCIEKETADINSATGSVAELTTKIKQLEAQIAQNQQELEEATKLRGKSSEEFRAIETELTQSISALSAAVTVLSKHQSFLQTKGDNHISSVASALSRAFPRFVQSHQSDVTPTQRATVEAFVQAPTFAKYESQSGEIFGILEQMKDTFTNDLKEARAQEGDDSQKFGELKALKKKLIKSDTESKNNKMLRKSEAQSELSESEASKAACEETLEKSTTMLAETTEQCATGSDEFEARTKSRQEEMSAVAEALKFLDSDEAHKMFGDTNFGFTQVSAVQKSRGEMARSVLQAAGRRYKNAAITALAQAIPAGTFDKVLHAIDDLVKDIKETMASDVKEKDSCTADINTMTKELAAKNNEIETLSAKKSQLETAISGLESAIETLTEEMAELNKQLNEAGSLRETQNSEYRANVANSEASIEVLNKALTVLGNVYETKLLQQPAAYKDSGKSSGGNTVLSMIRQIITDAQKEMELAIQSENQSQKAYEKFVRDTNDTITAKDNQKTEKKAVKAAKETSLQNTENTLTTETRSRDQKKIELDARKEACKFLFENFDIRQEHMQGEIDALKEAAAFLKGMTE
jgi:predicted nuclease with TOPRIM domain